MSNIVDNFKKNKIVNLTNTYNRTLYIINSNYNNEIRNTNRLRIHVKQKQTIINYITNKYQQMKNNLKSSFDNEINKLNSISLQTTTTSNTVVNEKESLNNWYQLRGYIKRIERLY